MSNLAATIENVDTLEEEEENFCKNSQFPVEVSSTRKLSRTPALSLSLSLPGFFLGRVEVCTLEQYI